MACNAFLWTVTEQQITVPVINTNKKRLEYNYKIILWQKKLFASWVDRPQRHVPTPGSVSDRCEHCRVITEIIVQYQFHLLIRTHTFTCIWQNSSIQDSQLEHVAQGTLKTSPSMPVSAGLQWRLTSAAFCQLKIVSSGISTATPGRQTFCGRKPETAEQPPSSPKIGQHGLWIVSDLEHFKWLLYAVLFGRVLGVTNCLNHAFQQWYSSIWNHFSLSFYKVGINHLSFSLYMVFNYFQ